jgi:glycosyltransferase involved in cell wall biosynthesis
MIPQIAVVIPVYNGANSLKMAIKSLNNQTFQDWVCIIVNDGSTDDTRYLLEKLPENKFVIINLEKNYGRGYARQKGLDQVRVLKIPYMCMLDADDWYYANKLQLQFSFMQENPKCTLMSTSMVIKDINAVGLIRPFEVQKKIFFTDYIDFVQLPHASSIIRVCDIDGVNYNEELVYSEDKDFLRRILIHKEYCFVTQATYCYNRASSFSFEKYKKSLLYDNMAISKLPISFILKAKYVFVNLFKIIYVKILSIFNKLDLYFLRSFKELSQEEKDFFLSQQNVINNEN